MEKKFYITYNESGNYGVAYIHSSTCRNFKNQWNKSECIPLGNYSTSTEAFKKAHQRGFESGDGKIFFCNCCKECYNY